MCAATGSVALTSCFKDEPLNAECDVEQVWVSTPNAKEAFYNLTDTVQSVLSTDSTVTFSVRSGADLSQAKVNLKVTEGATVEQTAGKGEPIEVGKSLRYRVTSQDGNWHRDYRIDFVAVTHTVTDTVKYDFEHYELEPRKGAYYIWHNVLGVDTNGEEILGNDWATGNPGYQVSRSSAKIDEYPTLPLVPGYDGAAIRLVTRNTGPFGAMVNMRIAAGNFFLGSFDVGSALKDAMKATRFGVPFDKRPVRFTGYYKYTPGPKFQDRLGKEVPGRVDQGSIYAVLYRNHDGDGNAVVLDGNNVLTSDQIVAIAQVPSVTATDGWTRFDIAFNYTDGIDNTLLANRGYNLAVVFSSSIDGATFQGAIGSELCVDRVRVVCATEQ